MGHISHEVLTEETRAFSVLLVALQNRLQVENARLQKYSCQHRFTESGGNGH